MLSQNFLWVQVPCQDLRVLRKCRIGIFSSFSLPHCQSAAGGNHRADRHNNCCFRSVSVISPSRDVCCFLHFTLQASCWNIRYLRYNKICYRFLLLHEASFSVVMTVYCRNRLLLLLTNERPNSVEQSPSWETSTVARSLNQESPLFYEAYRFIAFSEEPAVVFFPQSD
jgi:hypothetical protein